MGLPNVEKKEATRLVLLCICWYTISSVNNVVGKTLLNYFPYPMTLSMVQLLSITVYSGPVLRCLAIRSAGDISWGYYSRRILPLALGKFIAVLFAHISIWKVPLSYAHTVKATMPLFTVVLGRVLIGHRQTTAVYMSLVPIILGVAVASITELSFDMIGLCSALTSIAVYSLLQLYSKQVMNETGIHHMRLLHILGKLSFLMFFPIWVVFDLRKLAVTNSLVSGDSAVYTVLLLSLDGLLSFAQNVVAFTMLHLVTPLTYSVCNATKRISVIVVSLLLMRNPVTPTNVLGMMMAVGGVFLYNKAKLEANQLQRVAALLPVVQPGNALLRTAGINWADKVSPVYLPMSETSDEHLSNGPLSSSEHYSKGHYSNGHSSVLMAA